MSRYYNSYFDDDEELEALEDDDILEEEDVLEDDDDVLEEEDVLEDDDDVLEEEDVLEDDDDILAEEDYEDDDDVLEEDIEDDDELEDFEDAFYNDIGLGSIGGAIKGAAGKVAETAKNVAGKVKNKLGYGQAERTGFAKGVKNFTGAVRSAYNGGFDKSSTLGKIGTAVGKVGRAGKQGAQWVKNNPGKAAAIGAGAAAAGTGIALARRNKNKDSWYPYYDDDFEDSLYNDISLGAIGGAIKKAGKQFAGGFKASGVNALAAKPKIAEGISKLGGAAKAGRALGKGVDAAKKGLSATKNFVKNNPGKAAAIGAGAGAGAGFLAGRKSKDSWYPYNDGYYWDDDEELTGVDDIGVEDDGDIDEEELTIEQKADSILRDARRVLRDAKRKLRRSDAIILSDDDDELEAEVSEDIEDDDDVLEEEESVEDGCHGDDDAEAYGEQFDDDDDEPVDESEEIDVDKTQALRDITEATRGISDPHERKNVQDAVYGALCGRSQMADIMRVTRGNRNARMDSLFGTRGQMSVAGQQAIYDSFNPHKG